MPERADESTCALLAHADAERDGASAYRGFAEEELVRVVRDPSADPAARGAAARLLASLSTSADHRSVIAAALADSVHPRTRELLSRALG